jgi:DNA polymerase III subunit epsilon
MTRRAIYYDTETTGTHPETDRIVEIAAYCPETKDSFCRFVNPGRPIPPDAVAIHHITDEMVADAPPFIQIIPELVAFCEGDVVLIAHNNDAFDQPFLRHEFERAGLPVPSWPTIDSLKWARRYRPDLPRHSLQFLCESFGVGPRQSHRALDDVLVLHKIFSQMIDDLSYETVIELLRGSRKVTRMPFGKHRGLTLQEVPASYLRWLSQSGALAKPENATLREALQELSLIS